MRQRPLAVVFLALMIIIIILKNIGFCFWQDPILSEELKETIRKGERFRVTGVVSSRDEKTNSYSYFLSDAVITDPDQNSYSIRNIQLYIPKSEKHIKIGSGIEFTGRLNLYENASNPGGFNAADYYAAKGCAVSAYSEEYVIVREGRQGFKEGLYSLRERINETIRSNMKPEAAEVLCAMITGSKSEMDDETKLDYQISGLSHILCISGLHISLFGMTLYRLLLKLRVGIVPACLSASVLTAFYCIFTGGSDSAFRAFISFCVVMLARCLKQSYDPPCALSLSGIIILIIRPRSLFTAGFQLGFAASFGAGFLYPEVSKSFEDIPEAAGFIRKKLRASARGAILWGCINAATLPVMLYHFCRFPVYSLITNLLFVPLMTPLLIISLSALSVLPVMPAAGRCILFIPEALIQWEKAAGELIRRLPCSFLVTGRPKLRQMILSYAAMAVFFILLKYKKHILKCLPAVLFSCLVLIRLPEGFSVSFLDVGQGDSIVVNTDTSKTFLVDGGSSSQKDISKYILEPYFLAEGITDIEGIMVTHTDEDHMNGIDGLLNAVEAGTCDIRVHNIFLPVSVRNDEDIREIMDPAERLGINIRFVKKGDEIKTGNTVIKVIFPEDESLTKNAGSLVLKVQYGEFSALLTGDSTAQAEEMMLWDIEKCQVLKAGHHGSSGSTSEEFLKKAEPAVCVISAPRFSRYGHPHKETIERIEGSGAVWYQTGVSGMVRVTVQKERFYVDTFK